MRRLISTLKLVSWLVLTNYIRVLFDLFAFRNDSIIFEAICNSKPLFTNLRNRGLLVCTHFSSERYSFNLPCFSGCSFLLITAKANTFWESGCLYKNPQLLLKHHRWRMSHWRGVLKIFRNKTGFSDSHKKLYFVGALRDLLI